MNFGNILMSQKITFITGANSGLGLETALAAKQLGHNVIAGFRNANTNLLPERGSTFAPIRVDVLDENSIINAVKHVIEKEGRLDTVICNAGIMIDGLVEGTSIDEFTAVMDVNFLGVIRTIQAVLPYMRDANAGRIIVISSLSGIIGLPGTGAYTASKFAIEGLCECLQAEVSRFGIEICLAQPGAFQTNLGRPKKENSVTPIPDYRHLQEFFYTNRNQSTAAASASVAGREIAALIDIAPLPFRIPIGDQAREITEIVPALSSPERAKFSLKAAGIDWWAAGEDGPSN